MILNAAIKLPSSEIIFAGGAIIDKATVNIVFKCKLLSINFLFMNFCMFRQQNNSTLVNGICLIMRHYELD